MAAPIDLRSDTVTRPSAAMLAAMASAQVGDDVYGEDPTVQRLEEEVASRLGKEAALFVSSGTMGNQIALLCQTRRGDEIVVGEGAHCAYYESGAASAWAGVQPLYAGRGGLFTAADLDVAVKPKEYWHPRTSLVAIENTHNRAGGRVFPQADVLAIAAFARERGLALHLDGARLWNASIASGLSAAELAAPFDSVSVCFSKGLGAPVGSAIAGSRDLVREARRFRKMLGGGMRQVGVLAAAALFALEKNLARLAEDHANARALGAALAEAPEARVAPIETNIVMVELPGLPAARVVAAAASRGVRVSAFGPERLRLVTHLDVPSAAIPVATAALRAAMRDVAAEAPR
jgi:threonine aldolase